MNQKESNPTVQTPETDFVSFYLEQEGQKSNVYYASARQSATVYYKILPGKVIYRKTGLKIAATLAGICLILVSAGMFLIVSGNQARLSAESGALIENGYEEILSAQKALAELQLGRSFFGFNSAYQNFNATRSKTSSFSALALSAAQYWPFSFFAGIDGVDSGFKDKLARVGLEAADSAGLFLKALQEKEIVGMPAALEEIKNAQKNLKEAKEKLASANEPSFSGAVSQLSEVVAQFDYIIPRLELGVWASGIDRSKTFLVVVQNTVQARATGGAITSVGAITFENGRISKIFFDDVYNIDGQLQTKVIPPKPIQKIDTVWSLHNANWFLDFPTSAGKIAYFYQKSQGARPDGVIALNEKVLLKFLEITGPIELLKYDLIVDENNFSHLTAFNILDEKRVSQAKRVFNDFASALFSKLASLPEEKVAEFFDSVKESAVKKDALLWLNDEKHERVVSEAGWGGGVPPVKGDDYFSVGASNMSGVSNGFSAEQSIAKETEISENGEIVNTARVERKYISNGLPEKSSSESVPEYWRFYVPIGSELISASGFTLPESTPAIDYSADGFKTDDDVALSEKATRADSDANTQIFQESGKTVFGGWVSVSSGYPTLVTVKYKLSFSVEARDEINFVFQKQPGVESGLDFKVRRAGEAESTSMYKGDFSEDRRFVINNK